MSKKQKKFNKAFEQEKARVKLYKSGKNWISASIKEIEILKIMGIPFLTNNINKDKNVLNTTNDIVKKNALKTSAIFGGVFTVNLLHDHHALAASETAVTSEISSQSETVGNQNSTTITTSEKISSKSIVTTETSDINHKESVQFTSESLESTDKDETIEISEESSGSSETNTINSQVSTSEMTNSTNEKTSTSNEQTSTNKNLTSTTPKNLSSSENVEKQETVTNSVNSSASSTSTTSTSLAPKLRNLTRMATVNSLATPVSVTNVSANTVTVTKDNFSEHMNVSGSATYDPKTGIVTLTPDVSSQKGAITLGTRIDSNKSFHFSGKVNLGNKYEGYNVGGVAGGDGIGFAFSPGALGQTGLQGAALGIGGLNNAFGFKLDTYHNTSKPAAAAKALADPSNVSGGGAFGAFVTTDSNGVATTYTSSSTLDNAAKLNVQPTNNTFQDFDIDYNGDTKIMRVTYAGQSWSRNISDWIQKSGKTNFSLSMTASTGGARNLQQVQFGTFEYTESAAAQVRYVDSVTGKEIIPSKSYSGEVDQVIAIDKMTSKLNSMGYNYVTFDGSNAPTYDNTSSSIKMTNAGQTITYLFTDVKAPVLSLENQTQEVGKQITPITVTTTENSNDTVTNTVTGLPQGLTYDASTNQISGTPANTGQTTVTVTSTDRTGNKSTSTFKIDVIDTTAPTVSQITDKTSEVFSPITPITISTTDNSGGEVKNTVTGLPQGLTYSASTNQISGTPTVIGTNTITVVSVDSSGNKTTSTFKYEVTRNISSDSISTSSSNSIVNSTSKSLAESTSVSTFNSASESTSSSGSTSISLSSSESGSTSTSLSSSESGSKSLSASTSTSLSGSESGSMSLSTSTSGSESTSLSLSTSTSGSESTSTSLSGSESESTSLSTSTSGSESTSTSLS
ncbi:lectin-like domain-containing protein, partial [Mammaliicoccus stepanovicii]